ncbi:MAG: lamin tail domain-containing protein [Akkermansiaceae bacterium]
MSRTLTIILGAVLSGFASGDVVINEIAATHTPRNLRWDENDQAYAGAGPAWWTMSFDDSRWESGNLPVGYSLGSISTDLGADLRNVSPSFYVRKTFEVSLSEASSSAPMVLGINYNDGFIAWINGVEVARRNMGAVKAHVYHDQLSHRGSTLGTSNESITLPFASELLVEGENVIAVQVNNSTLTSNMRLDMSLQINEPSGADPQLFSSGGAMTYLPGLREPTAGLVDLATPLEDPSDWIELHNNGDEAVDLEGWSLSDDLMEPLKWSFPAGTTIPAGGYLVVLADDPDEVIPGAGFLHANFKLSSGGEYLGLYDAAGNPVSEITPEYPRQFPNYSYGLTGDGQWRYFETPSPEQPNSGAGFIAKADAPDFSQKGGFYDSAIAVTLTSMTPGVTIRYTTNGTEPTLENGSDYALPLALNPINSRRGHVIRARSFRDGFIASNIKTHTFLINQDARVRTSPSLVYAGDPQRALYDPFGVLGINGGSFPNNQWQPSGVFDYNNVINRGRAYERPIHAEYYFQDGTPGFRTDVGLRIAASSWSRPRMQLTQTASSPWPDQSVQKPSFNLYFRDDYGNPSVDLPLNGPARTFSGYERFRIRAGKNDIRNPFIIDELFRRLSSDMGNGASLGVINSLYVNGDLKGYYNMVERLREPFLRSLHSNDDDAQWDVLQFEGNDNIAEGDKTDWNDMISRLNAAVSTQNWERVLEVADVENMANYYLLNIYGATWDWPHNNWVAAKERSAEGRYRLYVWDAEGAMNNAGNRPVSQEMIRTYILGTSNGQTGQTGTLGELRDLWRGLNRWEEFRLLFADQIQRHLFNGGILDDRDQLNSHIRQRFDGLEGEFEDLLRLIGNQSVDRGDFLRWINPSIGRRRYLFGPIREEFRDNDLWPEIAPPAFSQFGGTVSEGYPLLITNENATLYYTTDGTDPRLPGGTPNPDAISQSGGLQDEVLVEEGSSWNHNATEGDLGVAWRLLNYDDGLWESGPAPLGYGGISSGGVTVQIATEVNSSRPRQPTSYFRKIFEIDDPAAYLSLEAKLLVDGGIVIFVNGVEAFRGSNIPSPSEYSSTPTSDTDDGNESDYRAYPIDPALLISGSNIIAIELHNSTGNSDMALDVGLRGKRAASGNLPIFLNEPLMVKARSFENGEWSAVTSASFTVDAIPASSQNLAFSEILYNPIGANQAEIDAGFDDGDFFEFIRLENFSQETVDLGLVRLTDGVIFDFSDSDIRVLGPGKKLLLVKSVDAFRFRYGTDFDDLIAGEYSGQLSNGGEQIRLIGQEDAVIHEFAYNDSAPWPDLSALDGYSIQVIDRGGDHGDATNWRASGSEGGSPGGRLDFASWQAGVFSESNLLDVEISGKDADPDGDGWSNFFEFALGFLPLDSTSVPGELASEIRQIEGENYLTVTVTRASGERAVRIIAQVSDDLSDWMDDGVLVLPELVSQDGSVTSTYRHPLPIESGEAFLRLKAIAE